GALLFEGRPVPVVAASPDRSLLKRDDGGARLPQDAPRGLGEATTGAGVGCIKGSRAKQRDIASRRTSRYPSLRSSLRSYPCRKISVGFDERIASLGDAGFDLRRHARARA